MQRFDSDPERCAAATVAAVSDSLDDEIDFRGSRRLVGAEEWIWYLIAGVTYIVLGIWHKWLLNWFVGPAWLVAFIVVGPWLTDRLTDRLGVRRRSSEHADR